MIHPGDQGCTPAGSIDQTGNGGDADGKGCGVGGRLRRPIRLAKGEVTMVAFENSRPIRGYTSGKIWPAPAACSHLKQFRVYRWNPDAGGNPVQDVFSVDLDQCGPMVLDALIKIKNEIELDADFPPLLPRGCLRLLCHEHRRRQSFGLHNADRSHQGRRPHLSAKSRAGDQGSGRRSEPSLCPAPADQTVVADGHACAAGRRTAAVDRGAGTDRRLLGMHPVLLLHHRMPELVVDR